METPQETLTRAKAMLEQTKAEGSKPFKGSSYDKRSGPAETVNPAEANTNLNLGINKVIDEGRKMRQDKTMDFMNGVVPPGALPASSFAQVLRQFNSSSAPLEASLAEGAMADARQIEKIKVDTQNSIRQLALDVGKNGGSQETVNAITALIESGDIDAAIKVGATALQEWEQVGSNIITRNPDGTVKVIWSAPQSESGPTRTQIENDQEEAAKTSVENDLRTELGGDGKTNPFTYNQKYQEIVVEGGMPEAQFFKDFPPDKWLNYADQAIDARVRVWMKKPSETKATDTVETLEQRQERLLDNNG